MHSVYFLSVKVTVTVPTVPDAPHHAFTPTATDIVIAESEREGTRAETRIGLSAKRTSPFKSAGGGSVQ